MCACVPVCSPVDHIPAGHGGGGSMSSPLSHHPLKATMVQKPLLLSCG